MKFLNNIFRFYINSSIHIALSVCSLVAITALEFNFSVSKELYWFCFFGTITGYNFVKYAEVARLKHKSLDASLRTIQIFSFFCFIALCYFMFQLSFKTLLVTSAFAFLTFFYAVPFLMSKNLRSLVGIKILIVAVVWAGVTVIIPVVNEEIILQTEVGLTFFQRVLFVLALTLPFEIRDLKYDESALGTLPQKTGIFYTKIIGILLLGFVFLLQFFKQEWNLNYVVSIGVISGVLTVVLFFSKKRQSLYFASFWVEGIPILWLGLLLAFKYYFAIS